MADERPTREELLAEVESLRLELEKLRGAGGSATAPNGYPGDLLEWYKALVRGFPTAVLVMDPETRILEASQKSAELLGLESAETLRGTRGLGFIAPEDLDRAKQNWRRRLQGEDVGHTEYRLLRKDGGCVDVALSAALLRDEAGKPSATITAMWDITAHRAADKARHASESRFRSLAETTAAGIFIYAGERNLYVNPAASTITGYSADELTSMRFWEVIHPDSRADVQQRGLARQRGEEVSSRYEVAILTKQGETRWLDFTAGTIEYQGEQAVLGTVFDITGRRQAEEALRESELRYRTTLRSMQDAIHVVDRELRVLLLNERFSEWTRELGLETGAVGQELRQVFPFLSEQVMAEYHQVFEEGQTLVTEESLRLGGRELHTQTVKIPVHEEGRVGRVVTVVRDITARKLAENALRESERKFRTLSEESPNMIFISQGGKVVYANARCERLMGYSRQELCSEEFDFMDLIAPESKGAIAANVQKHRRGEEVPPIEYQLVTRDGKLLDGLLATRLIDYAGDKAILGIVTDLTRYKQAQAALQESEAKYRSLVDTMPDPVVILQDGQFRYASRAFHELLGYSPIDLETGLPIEATVASEYREAARQRYEEGLAGKTQGGHFRVDLLSRDETVIPCESSMAGVRFRGQPAVLVIIRDIRERIKAEKERKELETRMQQAQKLESLGVLAGGIAHDFNNLLTGVLGHAELAETGIDSESPSRPHVQQIRIAALRLADLTSQLLAYSGRASFVVEPVDLSRLVEEMAHLVELSISKSVTLRFDFASVPLIVEAAAAQLRQVVMNLITNASEAIGDDVGTISISTRTQTLGISEFDDTMLGQGLAAGQYATLEVSDTGCGMDQETRSRIFDPFYSTKFTGRGLGLAAALGIVRGHHGAIQVRSAPGRGTTFCVLLPLADSQAQEAAAAASEGWSDWRGSSRMLVVDDEEPVRLVAKALLERHGFQVVTATNGQEALDLMAAPGASFAAVLLDLTMPGLSGQQVFSEIRRRHDRLPVILMSGYSEEEATAHFLDGAPTAFVQKPFRMRTLVEALRRALPGDNQGPISS